MEFAIDCSANTRHATYFVLFLAEVMQSKCILCLLSLICFAE